MGSMMKWSAFAYLMLTIGCSLAGQALLKRGIRSAIPSPSPTPLVIIREYGLKCLVNPQILMGTLLCGLAFVTWVYLLSIYDLSRALPILGGLTLLIAFLVGVLILGEKVHWINAVGIAVLIAGIVLLSYQPA